MNQKFMVRYKTLESQVHNALKRKIERQGLASKFINGKSIKLEMGQLNELVVIDDKLVFINHEGMHYNYYCVTIDRLIDILDDKCNRNYNLY